MSQKSDIEKLLRLKRYELPPEDYLEDFLHEFHRRQRAAIIQRPTLEILWDRFLNIAPSFRVPAPAYAFIVVVALTVSGVILGGGSLKAPSIARNDSSGTSSHVTLVNQPPVTIESALPASTGSHLPPHYVLENRPVSHEAPLSF